MHINIVMKTKTSDRTLYVLTIHVPNAYPLICRSKRLIADSNIYNMMSVVVTDKRIQLGPEA